MSIGLAKVPGCLSNLCNCPSHHLHSQWLSVFECNKTQQCPKGEDHYQYLNAGHFLVSVFYHLMYRSHSTSFWDSDRGNCSMCSCILVYPWEEGNARASNIDILVQSLVFSIMFPIVLSVPPFLVRSLIILQVNGFLATFWNQSSFIQIFVSFLFILQSQCHTQSKAFLLSQEGKAKLVCVAAYMQGILRA